MAMAMQEMFYGESEPVYFVQYGRRTSVPYGRAYQMPAPVEYSTIDLMVPMCCPRCEDEVREALFALGGVRDVLCDGRKQRVTVTGYLDGAQALKQVRRVKSGATAWSSSHSTRRCEQKWHRYVPADDNRSSFGREERSVPGRNYSRPSGDGYDRSLCPAYRDSTETHYMSVHPTIATRVEIDC